ncbi:MAG: ferredoxin:thioredoxin reductase [Methanomicrobiales archaeon]|nr:ferredoxin:thioredoxin reductase [Methanomicrobiales archaeon]
MTSGGQSVDEGEVEAIRRWAEEYARAHGFTLNTNKKQLGTVLRGLARNRAKLGEQYCPCRLRTGDKEKDRIIICPCVYHKDEVTQSGHCHCNLFFEQPKRE